MKDPWWYHKAQKNVFERLQKDWDPPAAPCVTPMTSFLKRRIEAVVQSQHPDHSYSNFIKVNKIQQWRLCTSYNLQLNDLNALMLKNKCQDGVNNFETGKKTVHDGVCVSYTMKKSMTKSDRLRTPKVHPVVLQYKGPQTCYEDTLPFIKKAFSQKLSHTSKVNRKTLSNSHKTFYIDMPQSRLRVGNLEPKKSQTQQKRKEIFKP
ncbi:uncharacterized protein LOC143942343 [Lithobates pipiens]